jgi:Tol biopolymer transport system component
MTLANGTKFGPYEILSSIGAGGMGEVYRARDTRLQRIVAIKVLPESLSSDRDRLERFQQEARILSALNHPNLMAIYDVGFQDGVHFLVSEFLDGQSLRDVIAAGPLPQRRVSEYGLQIAKGLAAAHEKGIIHRDLKPENIFVLRDERMKILDFGLAKQAWSASANNATMTSVNRTAAGTVLGTAAYMSPEQVRGEELDHRSDIFSFGTILYEMCAGGRAFKGDSGVEVMNSILKEEPPDLSESGLHVSLGMQRIIQRCLEKKPEARFQSASDLAFALDSLSSAGTASGGLRAIGAPKKSRTNLLLAVCLVSAICIAAFAVGFLLRRPAPAAPDFTQVTFHSQYIRSARFGPDGRTIVYGATIDAKPSELFSTRTDTIEDHSLGINADVLSASTNGELAVSLNPLFNPLLSPTGRLARVPLGGGATRELLDGVIDADWSADGAALAVSRQVGSRWRLEYPIGKMLYETNGYISDVRISPAGDKIAFVDHATLGDDRGTIDLIDLNGQRRVLTHEYSSAQGLAWSPNGQEVWFTSVVATERAILRAVDMRGNVRVLLAAPVRLHLQDVSKDGTVLLTTEDFRWQSFVSDVGGQPHDMTSVQWQNAEAISRDGRMLLFNAFDIGGDSSYFLFIRRVGESAPVMIGEGEGLGFSYDSKWAAALDPTKLDQMRIIPIGIGEARSVQVPPPLVYQAGAWMPDGNSLLIVAAAPGHAPATYIQEIATGKLRQVSPEGKFVPSRNAVAVGVSPDGKNCVVTDGEGHYWIQPLDGSAARELHGVGPDDYVIEWHSDSGHLFIARRAGSEGELDELDIATGQRKVFLRFSPPDKAAAIDLSFIIVTPDGAHYGYCVPRIFSTLYLAKGIH